MPDYPCFRFTPARHRAEHADLGPPLQLAEGWTVPDVAYTPLAAGGRVFVSFGRGEVAAFDADAAGAAAPQWTFTLDDGFRPLPPHDGALLLHDGVLLVRTGDDLITLDVTDGRVLDRHRSPRLDLWFGASVGGRIVAGFATLDEHRQASFHLAGYEPARRSVVWEQPIASPAGPIAVAGRVTCAATGPGVVKGIDIEAGQPLWSFDVTEVGKHRDHEVQKRGEVVGIPLATKDAFVLGVAGHHVLALDALTGRLRWDRTLPARWPSSLSGDADGKLHLLEQPGYWTLDAATGTIVSEANVAAAARDHGLTLFTEVDVSEEYVFGADLSGTLFAMRRRTAQVEWTFRCRARILHAPVVVGGRLYAADLDGTLYTFESADGYSTRQTPRR
jgi:hypothetical protein